MRAVSVLEVSDPAIWTEIEAVIPAKLEVLDARRRVVVDEEALLAALQEAGLDPLIRYAHRGAAEIEAARHDLEERVAALPTEARRVLLSAQRHALEGTVSADHAWDPRDDAPWITELHQAGLLAPLVEDGSIQIGRFRLHPDLRPLPPMAYDFDEAVMDETEDLPEDGPGVLALLHDVAALAAALHRRPARRTHAGLIGKADARALGRLLADAELIGSGELEAHPIWGRALAALEALGAVSLDPLSRELFVDLGIEELLEGSAEDAVDRIVHRLVDRDLQVVLPAVRASLKQAGPGAVDEVVFLELLAAQDREVLFPPWWREHGPVYPGPDELHQRPYDDAGWERVERRMIEVVLRRVERLGLIRRAPGVFAGTADGRRWAGVEAAEAPPIWVTSDLEVLVPPAALWPWEQFQLERLARCLSRDVADRYRLDRESLQGWLATHEFDEALALLRRRAAGLPPAVEETLRQWALAATRLVLTRGVVLP